MALQPASNINTPITAQEMYEADKYTINSGISSKKLMDKAGKAAATEILKRHHPSKTLVLCGTGNNGGDGFIAASYLKQNGWDVAAVIIGNATKMSPDNKAAKERFLCSGGQILPLLSEAITDARLLVDAIFGIGLTRPISGKLAATIVKIKTVHIPTIAIDMPSGIHTDTGKIMGVALKAEETVTFHRIKMGHTIEPGKHYSGRVIVKNIGIIEPPAKTITTNPNHALD